MRKQCVTSINKQVVIKEESHMEKYEKPTIDIVELHVNEIFTLGVDNGSCENGVNPPEEDGWG